MCWYVHIDLSHNIQHTHLKSPANDITGKSKTRLAPLLGSEGAALLAQAMLSDILVSLSECVSYICYAIS